MTKPAISFRRGQLLAGVESARAALQVAHRSVDLLSADDRKLLVQSMEIWRGLEQRLWSRKP